MFWTLLFACVALALGFGSDECPSFEIPEHEAKPTDAFDLNLMSWAVGAACLDGSPPAYYFQKGTGSGVNKWYIHHQGGGWCESMEDCYGRSFSRLGSSKDYKKVIHMGGANYFGTNSTLNPLMYNWNKVFIPYCDGGSFSGNNNTVTTYKGKKLYFRGHVNLNSVISWLVGNSNLEQATDVVISGCSAGGLATYLHTDRWAEVMPMGAKVVGLPDSGFFLDYQDMNSTTETTIPGNYHNGLVWVFNQMNATTGVDSDCIKHWAPQGKAWKCMFAQHVSPFVKTPLFALQSQYDAWQTGHELKQPPTVADINAYGKMFKQIFEKQFLAQKRNGAHLDCCHHHCGEWDKVHTNGDTQAVAFKKWYEAEPKKSPRWIQNKPYPCTACCN